MEVLLGEADHGSYPVLGNFGDAAAIPCRGVLSAPQQVEAELPAHSGGVVALDIRGDLVATAGYGMRHGQLVIEQFVKVCRIIV